MAQGVGCRWLAGLCLAVSLVVSGGCHVGGPPFVAKGEDPVILVATQVAGPQDSLPATLRFDDESRCLFLDFPDPPGPPMLPVWPMGTEPVLVEGRRGVTVPEGDQILDGATFTGRGAGLEWREAEPLLAGLGLPDGCMRWAQQGGLAAFDTVDTSPPQ